MLAIDGFEREGRAEQKEIAFTDLIFKCFEKLLHKFNLLHYTICTEEKGLLSISIR